MKYHIYLIVSICMIINACTECKESDTELTNETKEWFDYYQKNEYSVFANNNLVDTLFIVNKYPEINDLDVNFPVDNCSSHGDCFCEIRSFDLVSNKLKLDIRASSNQKIRIVIGDDTNNQTRYYTEDRMFEDFAYEGLLIDFEYKNSLYEALELQCTDTDCKQLSIQRIVISKELGVLEYEVELGNVWVKQ